MNCVSITQETIIKAVSNFRIHLPKRFSKKNETLAGVTYPIPPLKTPACKLAPGHNKEIGVLARSEKLRGDHFRLATQFREHLTGAQNPCCVTSFCKVRGSNPHQSIPSQFHNCVGNRMNGVNKPRSLYLSVSNFNVRPIAQRLELHNQIRGTIVADGSSILSQGIPNGLNLQLFRSDPGAGTIFKPLPPTHTPAPTIIIGGNLCGS